MVHASLKRRAALVSAASLSLLGVASAARAGTVYGLGFTGDDEPRTLVRFDSATPGDVTTIGPISGLAPAQVAAAIDFRPATMPATRSAR